MSQEHHNLSYTPAQNILYKIIIDKVYDTSIHDISLGTDQYLKWVMDFKGQVVDREFLENYASEFFKMMRENNYREIQIGGLETGALPIISALTLLDQDHIIKNAFYMRKSRKKSSHPNRIEGEVLKDIPIVLVDDVLNSGGSFKKQETILSDETTSPISAIFAALRFRDMEYYTYFLDKGIKVLSIFELNNFSEDIDIKNIESTGMPEISCNKYTITSRLQLAKPNLYIVVPKSAPLLEGDYIYQGLDSGEFVCINKDTGARLWTFQVRYGSGGKYILSSPAIYGDYVFFGAYDGVFHCLNKHTGKIVWVNIDGDWVGSSPCIDPNNGIVYIGLKFGLFRKRGGILTINIKTGKPLWKNYKTMTEYTHASPAYNKKHNILTCGCDDTFFRAYDAKTGEIKWEYKTEGEIQGGAIFDDKRNLVIFGGSDGGIYILHMEDGKLYHRFEARYGFYGTPAQSGSIIIGGSMDRMIYAFDIDIKETLWTYTTGGRIFASPLIFESSVYIGSNDGRLYEINIYTGSITSTIQFSERIVNRIQIEKNPNGKKILYIPTQACELYKAIEN